MVVALVVAVESASEVLKESGAAAPSEGCPSDDGCLGACCSISTSTCDNGSCCNSAEEDVASTVVSSSSPSSPFVLLVLTIESSKSTGTDL